MLKNNTFLLNYVNLLAIITKILYSDILINNRFLRALYRCLLFPPVQIEL